MFKFSTLLFLVSAPALLSARKCTPSTRPHEIHPNGDRWKCLDVRGGVFADGTPVQIYDCNGSDAQKWNISPLNTGAVKSHNHNFCLDAGSDPASGVGMKIWTCYDGLAAQTWYYTGDKRIVLSGRSGELCLDLTNGLHVNSNQVQTWTCTDNNFNQVWTLD